MPGRRMFQRGSGALIAAQDGGDARDPGISGSWDTFLFPPSGHSPYPR
jgi:hypothetical protein